MPNPQRSPEAEAEQGFRNEFETVMDSLALQQGQPLDTSSVSDPRKFSLWGIQDPRVDPDQFSKQLQTQGFQPQDLQSMLIVQNHPELAEAYGQPQQDPGVVQDLTMLARHPFRLGTYNHIQDPDERVAEAERIHRGWLKSRGEPKAPVAPAEDPQEPGA